MTGTLSPIPVIHGVRAARMIHEGHLVVDGTGKLRILLSKSTQKNSKLEVTIPGYFIMLHRFR
jgi:hypothetical protein